MVTLFFCRQAINALWKKVSNMQTIPEISGTCDNGTAANLGGQDIVQDLTKTCSMLTNQVRSWNIQLAAPNHAIAFRFNNFRYRCAIFSTAWQFSLSFLKCSKAPAAVWRPRDSAILQRPRRKLLLFTRLKSNTPRIFLSCKKFRDRRLCLCLMMSLQPRPRATLQQPLTKWKSSKSATVRI